MSQVAFVLKGRGDNVCPFQFRERNIVDHYDGEVITESTQNVDIVMERATAGQYSIYWLRTSSNSSFRRNWSHIRNDNRDVVVFWFVRKGSITFSINGDKKIVNAGWCAVTRSNRPFFQEIICNENGQHETINVAVPAHSVYGLTCSAVEFGIPIQTSKGVWLISDKVFQLLFEQEEFIDENLAEDLVNVLLAGITRSVTADVGIRQISITDRRISDIVRYIDQNFCNPDLNGQMVASVCGISVRYLCHILKEHDMSLSDLIWERRIRTAREMLQNPEMAACSISEIAYMAGFKSSAHFSRKIKSCFNCSPTEMRERDIAAQARADLESAASMPTGAEATGYDEEAIVAWPQVR